MNSMTRKNSLVRRLQVAAWLPTAAWATGAGTIAFGAAGVAAFLVGERLSALPDITRSEWWEVVAMMIMLAGVYCSPFAAALAVGRRAKWCHAAILCQVIGVASFVALLALTPGLHGLAEGAVAVAAWSAAGLVAGFLCAARAGIQGHRISFRCA
jgi:hypothetical protein